MIHLLNNRDHNRQIDELIYDYVAAYVELESQRQKTIAIDPDEAMRDLLARTQNQFVEFYLRAYCVLVSRMTPWTAVSIYPALRKIVDSYYGSGRKASLKDCMEAYRRIVYAAKDEDLLDAAKFVDTIVTRVTGGANLEDLEKITWDS